MAKAGAKASEVPLESFSSFPFSSPTQSCLHTEYMFNKYVEDVNVKACEISSPGISLSTTLSQLGIGPKHLAAFLILSHYSATSSDEKLQLGPPWSCGTSLHTRHLSKTLTITRAKPQGERSLQPSLCGNLQFWRPRKEQSTMHTISPGLINACYLGDVAEKCLWGGRHAYIIVT